MRHDDYVDADEMLRREAERQAARDDRWERIWEAAVAIHAAKICNPDRNEDIGRSVQEAEALVAEWEKRKEQAQ